jgi:hypothetical protein
MTRAGDAGAHHERYMASWREHGMPEHATGRGMLGANRAGETIVIAGTDAGCTSTGRTGADGSTPVARRVTEKGHREPAHDDLRYCAWRCGRHPKAGIIVCGRKRCFFPFFVRHCVLVATLVSELADFRRKSSVRRH